MHKGRAAPDSAWGRAANNPTTKSTATRFAACATVSANESGAAAAAVPSAAPEATHAANAALLQAMGCSTKRWLCRLGSRTIHLNSCHACRGCVLHIYLALFRERHTKHSVPVVEDGPTSFARRDEIGASAKLEGKLGFEVSEVKRKRHMVRCFCQPRSTLRPKAPFRCF